MRRLAPLVACLVSLALAAPAVAEPPTPAGAGTYRPPVDAPIVDPFRGPANPYGPGNRGVDYDTDPGTPVHSSHDGEVVFAGPVAGSLHVVVLHPDGVRTSYSFLESAAVRRGDRVTQGQRVGTAGDSLHFGARVGDVYIDPTTLFGSGLPEVYLVPDEELRPQSEERERRGVLRMLTRLPGRLARGGAGAAGWAAGGAVDVADWTVGTAADAAAWARNGAGDAAGVAADAAGWTRDQAAATAGTALDAAQWAGGTAVDAAAWAAASSADAAEWTAALSADVVATRLEELLGLVHYAREFTPATHAWRAIDTVRDWWEQRGDCTADDVAVRAPPEQRRLGVLVAGLGSTSEHAAIDELDTAGLGYAPDDVMRFSYAGGTTNDAPYDAVDTTADLRQSGRRLRELLERLAVEHPGVPVDILAHSQGGLVARSALAYEGDADDSRLPSIANLVTLGTPHRGTDGATAMSMFGHSGTGSLAKRAVGEVLPGGFDPNGNSLAQMAETSEFMRRLNKRPLPPDVRARSIGAREDLVVPAGRTNLGGAENVIVSVPGHLRDHDGLPSAPDAQREVALALSGLPPGCQSLANMLADYAVSDAIGVSEDATGAALWGFGRGLDARFPFLPSNSSGRSP